MSGEPDGTRWPAGGSRASWSCGSRLPCSGLEVVRGPHREPARALARAPAAEPLQQGHGADRHRYATNPQVVIDADSRLVVSVGRPVPGNRRRQPDGSRFSRVASPTALHARGFAMSSWSLAVMEGDRHVGAPPYVADDMQLRDPCPPWGVRRRKAGSPARHRGPGRGRATRVLRQGRRVSVRAARSEASACSWMLSSYRQAVVAEATGPNTSVWSRSTARSAMASPPSVSVIARSVAIRPGSCPVPRGRRGRREAECAAVSPGAPARNPIPGTWKLPSPWTGRTPQQGSSSQSRKAL